MDLGGDYFEEKKRRCVGGGHCVGDNRSGHGFGSQLRGTRGGSWGLHQCWSCEWKNLSDNWIVAHPGTDRSQWCFRKGSGLSEASRPAFSFPAMPVWLGIQSLAPSSGKYYDILINNNSVTRRWQHLLRMLLAWIWIWKLMGALLLWWVTVAALVFCWRPYAPSEVFLLGLSCVFFLQKGGGEA